MNELLSIGGILNLSLSELLGDSFLVSRVPTSEYMEDEKGKKKSRPDRIHTERDDLFGCGGRI